MPRLSKKQRVHAQRIIDFYADGRPTRSLDSIGKQRDESEPPIVAALEKCGARVWKMHQPCDLLVRFHAKLFLLDCARKSKFRTDEQLALFDEWGVVVVDTPMAALRAIGAVK